MIEREREQTEKEKKDKGNWREKEQRERKREGWNGLRALTHSMSKWKIKPLKVLLLDSKLHGHPPSFHSEVSQFFWHRNIRIERQLY